MIEDGVSDCGVVISFGLNVSLSSLFTVIVLSVVLDGSIGSEDKQQVPTVENVVFTRIQHRTPRLRPLAPSTPIVAHIIGKDVLWGVIILSVP